MSDTALVIGEALIDEVISSSGEIARHPGGSPANVAVGLARLGRDARLLTWLGADADGEVVREHVRASGASVVSGSPAASTSVARATLDAAGVASYQFDLTWDLASDADLPTNPLVVHTGSIAAVIEPGASAVRGIVNQARSHATITYDPNARPALMGDPASAAARIESLVELADVVKVSDEDLGWLYPDSAPHDVARRWLGLGPAVVVVTLGGEGAVGLCAAGEVRVKPAAVTVVDTVGAGDSFMSGLIDGLWTAGLLGAGARSRLASVSTHTLTAVLERCAVIAGITVSRAGANPPSSAELGE